MPGPLCTKTAWLFCPASLVIWGPLGGWHLLEDDNNPLLCIHVVLLYVRSLVTVCFLSSSLPLFSETPDLAVTLFSPGKI